MTDPYRDAAPVPACPVCATPLDVDAAGVIACRAGCGDWLSTAYLGTIVELPLPFQASPAGFLGGTVEARPHACPRCAKPLTLTWLDRAPLYACVDDGLWVAAHDRARLGTELAGAIAHHARVDRVRATLAALASGEPAALTAHARYLVDLEERLAALEARIIRHLGR